MKISISSLTTLLVIIGLLGCGNRLFTKRDLLTQNVPEILKSKTWTLKQITIGRKLNSPSFSDYLLYNSNSCPFIFQFADKGKLITDFKANKLYGTYLIERDKIKHLNFGWKMKIIWTGNPECKITPTELSYVLGGSFQFKIEGNTLILKNQRGDEFTLKANS